MKHVIGLLFISPFFLVALSYDVNFVGLDDSACLKAIKSTSDLINLQKRPPASINGLKFRIESDFPALLKVMRAFSYYDASFSYEILTDRDPIQVMIYIDPGDPYKLASYEVFHGACQELAEVEGCTVFIPENLGLSVGRPAHSVDIVNAELQVLTELSRCGYPLAFIDKRRIEIDKAQKEMDAAVCVQEGPRSKFGPSFFFGLKNIRPRFIERRITWKEGELYNSDHLVETQVKLLKTDLFSSVYISHGEQLDEMGELPMKIRFTEAKHKQLSMGAYYATIDGPGASFTWTNRNFRGMGEVINITGDFSKRFLAGEFSYKKPDFLTVDQTYRAQVGLAREKIHPYLAFTYYLDQFIERKFDQKRTFSVGLELEHILVTKSATDGTYCLISLPLFVKYDNSNHPLDPSGGFTIVYSTTPYQSLFHGHQHFVKQRLTGTCYFPLTPRKKMVLALRAQLGSIAGAQRKNVPLTKLFLGGTEDELRGYRYMSVSPLNHKHQSLGGRSALYATAELRFRFGVFGVVPFADFGTVTSGELPRFDAKWFKSVGIGARYFAYFGPIRLDIGFPLNRRSFDPHFQIYASAGQAF
jgi:translocation and assembly module TamA